jgi:hypothetical protein
MSSGLNGDELHAWGRVGLRPRWWRRGVLGRSEDTIPDATPDSFRAPLKATAATFDLSLPIVVVVAAVPVAPFVPPSPVTLIPFPLIVVACPVGPVAIAIFRVGVGRHDWRRATLRTLRQGHVRVGPPIIRNVVLISFLSRALLPSVVSGRSSRRRGCGRLRRGRRGQRGPC